MPYIADCNRSHLVCLINTHTKSGDSIVISKRAQGYSGTSRIKYAVPGFSTISHYTFSDSSNIAEGDSLCRKGPTSDVAFLNYI